MEDIGYSGAMPHGQRIAELLLDIGAVKLSVSQPFTWVSGIQSPVYCDNRMIYSHPDARKFVVDAFVSRVHALPIPPDAIAGTATAAIGWAALVADRMHLPFVYVRSKAKDHGTKKMIEGDLKPDQQVVLIEDLISTAGSAITSVESLREEGKATVTDVVAIFTYELPAAAEKAQQGRVMLHPLSTFSILLEVAEEQGRIGKEEISLARRFIKDPAHWR